MPGNGSDLGGFNLVDTRSVGEGDATEIDANTIVELIDGGEKKVIDVYLGINLAVKINFVVLERENSKVKRTS